MELTDFQKGYIAALIDGEGSVCLTQNAPNQHRSPAVTISSTTQELLLYMQEIAGGTIVSKKKYKEHHKDAWQWALRGDRAIELLIQVYDYLLVPEKHYKAKLIVKEYKLVTPRNGKYSEEKLKAKLDFEKRFFEYDANY